MRKPKAKRPAKKNTGGMKKGPPVRSKDKYGVRSTHIEQILEAAPDAMIVADAGKGILMVNAQTEALFGYGRRELVGRPVEKLIPLRFRASHDGHRENFFALPKARSMGSGLDLYGLRKDGTEFPAEVSLGPVETLAGTLVVAAVRDITEHKRQMEEQNQRMLESARLKNEFLANMSHEFRTPLNAIIGFSELLGAEKIGPVPPEQKECLVDILTSARHLLQLINDILDLAKIEAGKMEFRPEPMDLYQEAQEVRAILRGQASAKRIQVGIQTSPSPFRATLDKTKFKQVLYNYLSNAIKFTPVEGKVIVRFIPEGRERFRLEVEDNGIGIPPEDIPNLFQEFLQLDASAAKKHPGTGLGLALTKRIVEAQGGKVGVRSEFGKGSTFYALLPTKVRKDT